MTFAVEGDIRPRRWLSKRTIEVIRVVLKRAV
jgi:hypothetical protein